MKISVVGSGYVGLSLAVLLSQNYDVTILDIDAKKIEMINKRISPINDKKISEFFLNKKLKLKATLNEKAAYENAEYIIIATPTNFDDSTGSFDTSKVENVISEIVKINIDCSIVIKSTIPLGFTESMNKLHERNQIFFSPEFLREGTALIDNLYPSRIVIGDNSKKGQKFGAMLANCAILPNKDIIIHHMNSNEAEAVKLFSNAYLAMRIAFFNELDTFAEVNNVSSKDIISAVSDDQRIGNYYNNPSFGYGGYCLPKDTKQLLSNYKNIPNNLIKAVIESNVTRKKFIVNSILKKNPSTVGIYRLAMKSGSDNYRESAVLDLIDLLKKRKIKINVYEPFIDQLEIDEVLLTNELEQFLDSSDLIIANRMSKDLVDVAYKVYSRDLFNEN